MTLTFGPTHTANNRNHVKHVICLIQNIKWARRIKKFLSEKFIKLMKIRFLLKKSKTE